MKRRIKPSRKPLVSIITPCFNSGKYLEECIDSVLAQDYSFVEHVIQDGASTDNTLSILKKYSNSKYKKRIRLVSEKDKGQSDGLNKALQRSRGDIFLVLNADDILLPYACSWGVEKLTENPECAVVYGDEYIIDEKGEIIDIHIGKHPYDYKRLFCVELVPPAQAAFIRRSMFEDVGFYADKTIWTCPDFEMWVRLGAKYPMKHEFGVISKYRRHPGSGGMQDDMVEKMVASKLTVINRVLANPQTSLEIVKLQKRAYAGLYHWACSVANNAGAYREELVYLWRSFLLQPRFHKLLRLLRLIRHHLILYIKKNYHRFLHTVFLSLPKPMRLWLSQMKKKQQKNRDFREVSIGKVARFWDRRPCNIRHSPQKIGTRAYFDEVEKRKYYVETHIPRFAQFDRWQGKKVLEIGCGIGTDTINFAKAGAQVTAVELSKRSVNLAKRRAKLYGLRDKIKFYHANAEELSKVVPIGKYDLIYSFGVIHHTPHPGKVIDEIKKYTHKNTIVKLMVYYRYSWKVLWIVLKYGKGAFWKINDLVAHYSEAQEGSPVTYVYTKKSVKGLLRGFTITEIYVGHIFPYDIDEYRRYRYKKLWYFNIIPKPLFRWLEKHFGWHLLVTAKSL